MCRLIIAITIALLLLFSNAKAQQWNPVTSLPATEFTTINSFNNKLYAAAGNQLYSSADGTNWQSETIHPLAITPTCMALFNGVLYVGTTDNGVYYRNIATGSTWNHALLGLYISHFTVHEGRLHLSTEGSGVWKNVAGTWNNMTNDLPTYSYNVSKIVSLDGKLYAFAGGNGTFYRFDPGTNKWIEDYFSDGYLPGLIIDDALTHNGVLFAANGHHFLRSEDHGANWTADGVGLLNGINRMAYKGAHSIYALSPDPNTNFTYLQKRSINAAPQSSWGNFNEVLQFFSYAIHEFNGKIYIASDQGVFAKADGSLGVENPAAGNPALTLYPSPSSDGNINIVSDLEIETVEVYDLNGRMIVSKTVNALNPTFHISGKGIYVVAITSGGQITTKKAVIQ